MNRLQRAGQGLIGIGILASEITLSPSDRLRMINEIVKETLTDIEGDEDGFD